MAVYLLITYDIEDPKSFEPYVPLVVPLLFKHGAEILAADMNPKKIEGDDRGVAVVLKFPNEESAMNWFNDPEYASVKKIRLDSTKNNSIYLAQEFIPPNE
ncbi:DUF1330 domain-containing protein [Aegicerativicinus sediminis]